MKSLPLKFLLAILLSLGVFKIWFSQEIAFFVKQKQEVKTDKEDIQEKIDNQAIKDSEENFPNQEVVNLIKNLPEDQVSTAKGELYREFGKDFESEKGAGASANQ